MSVKDDKTELKKLIKKLSDTSEVWVGIQGSKAEQPYEAGLTTVQVGEFHEFGLGVPRRSFLRDYFDQRFQQIERRLGSVAKRVLEGKATPWRALNVFGHVLVGEIQERISYGIPPPLSEERIKQKTVRGKKGTTPLIHTGQLRSSITHKVENKG
jgi:hypothetical protein